MAEAENVLGYSASVRGFLEGAADAFDVMSALPNSIAKAAPYWFIALHDPATLGNHAAAFGSLEDKLIHYAYAGNVPRGTVPLPQHTKKSNAEYIRTIEAFGVPGAKELYAECCELTHPASPSVMCFLDQAATEIIFNPDRDAMLIEEFHERHGEKILLLAQCSLNPAFVSLALLSRLNPDYPAPSDYVISGIGDGSAIASIQNLENFISTCQSKNINPMDILRRLN